MSNDVKPDLVGLQGALLNTDSVERFLRELQAGTFARCAAGALTLALRMASCNDLTDQLKSSLVSRAVIDQALGVIMATEHCPQDRALTMLRSTSQDTNVKLRDLAETIVTRATGEPPPPASAFEEDG